MIKIAIIAAVGAIALAAASAAKDAYIDPVAVAPEIYSTKLENDYVRTILTTARPGEWTPMHSHPGRVAVFLNDCVDRRANDKGEIVERKFAAGDAVWAPAETHGDFNYAFVAECRIIEVEVKAAK